MLDLSLFKNRTFAGANTVMLLVGLAMFGVFFYVSLYMQQVLGYSPIQAGAAFLPMTVLIIVARAAGRAALRPGRARWLVASGMIAARRSRSSCSRGMGVDSNFWTLLPAMILGGIGMALDDGPDDRDGDGLGAARQGGRRLGRAEQHAPGRRLARDRRAWARSSPRAVDQRLAAGDPRPVAFTDRASTTRSRSRR